MSNLIQKIKNRTNKIILSAKLPSSARQTIKNVRDNKLTYLTVAKLNRLANISIANEKNRIPGTIMEAGCALGGSSILMASLKNKDRALNVYDVFGMIPPPSEKDGSDVIERYEVIKKGDSKGIEGDDYYGYEENLHQKVADTFTQFGYPPQENNIKLIKGLLQDTLSVDGPVSLAHIDVDWYDPVYVCLERIMPNLSVGGAMVIDDYMDWSGCREATDDYFEDKKSLYDFDMTSGSLVVTRR